MNRYISYATVWQLKFANNLQNPEVAMLQVFHLHFIFAQLGDAAFTAQRLVFAEHFEHIKPYTNEQVAARFHVFLAAAK